MKSFAPDDRAGMVKDSKVAVSCAFCSSVYQFTPHETGVLSSARHPPTMMLRMNPPPAATGDDQPKMDPKISALPDGQIT